MKGQQTSGKSASVSFGISAEAAVAVPAIKVQRRRCDLCDPTFGLDGVDWWESSGWRLPPGGRAKYDIRRMFLAPPLKYSFLISLS